MNARSQLGPMVEKRNGVAVSIEQIDTLSAEAWRRPLEPGEERYLVVRIGATAGNQMLHDAAVTIGDLVHGKQGSEANGEKR